MDSAELIEQLADIHLPPQVTYWPPAPGWWVLALLVVAAAIWTAMLMIQKIKRRRICDFAQAELDTIYRVFRDLGSASAEVENDARLLFINQFNAIIRRVALWHFPNSAIASLSGTAWVDFIREKGDSSGMTDEIADAISLGRFKARCEVDVNQLYQFGQQWISSLYLNSTTTDVRSKFNDKSTTHA